MGGVFYGLTIVAVFVVIHWLVLNETKSGDGTARGLLGMKPWLDPAAKTRTRKPWQHPAERG
jgi:hypothetical protein